MNNLALCKTGLGEEDLSLPNIEDYIKIFIDQDIAQLYFDSDTALIEKNRERYKEMLDNIQDYATEFEKCLSMEVEPQFETLNDFKQTLAFQRQVTTLRQQLNNEIKHCEQEIAKQWQQDAIQQKEVAKAQKKGALGQNRDTKISYPLAVTKKEWTFMQDEREKNQRDKFERILQDLDAKRTTVIERLTQPKPQRTDVLRTSNCIKHLQERSQSTLMRREHQIMERSTHLDELEQSLKTRSSKYVVSQERAEFLEKQEQRQRANYSRAAEHYEDVNRQLKEFGERLEEKQKQDAERIQKTTSEKQEQYQLQVRQYEQQRKITKENKESRQRNFELKDKPTPKVSTKVLAMIRNQKKWEFDRQTRELRQSQLTQATGISEAQEEAGGEWVMMTELQ